jgi:hypothetical protein
LGQLQPTVDSGGIVSMGASLSRKRRATDAVSQGASGQSPTAKCIKRAHEPTDLLPIADGRQTQDSSCWCPRNAAHQMTRYIASSTDVISHNCNTCKTLAEDFPLVCRECQYFICESCRGLYSWLPALNTLPQPITLSGAKQLTSEMLPDKSLSDAVTAALVFAGHAGDQSAVYMLLGMIQDLPSLGESLGYDIQALCSMLSNGHGAFFRRTFPWRTLTKEYGTELLDGAVEGCDREMVELLLLNRVNGMKRGHRKASSLELAATIGNLDIVRTILAKTPRLLDGGKSKRGNSPAFEMYVSFRGFNEAIDPLLAGSRASRQCGLCL